MTLELGIADFFICIPLMVLAIYGRIRQWLPGRREVKWEAALEEHMAEVATEAGELNGLIDEIHEWDRKRNHYRHNIHCPVCGRFSRQAEGWPGGVSDCKYHGIEVHVGAPTGVINIVISPVDQYVEADVLIAELEFVQAMPLLVATPMLAAAELEVEWDHEGGLTQTGIIVLPLGELESIS